MKKIYIKENSIKNVVNGRLLPQFLFNMVKTHATSLGDNEIFPSGDEYPFDYILLKERFNEISDAIEELGIQDISEDGLMSELSSLLKECKELETPVRDSLERICENAVNRLFAIPKDIINIKCKLVDKINFKKSIRLRPESDEDIEYSFEDVQDIDFSKKAIGKRRVINSLIQGGSYLYANIIGLYASEINKINPRLLQLYRIITTINDYLLFIKKEEMTDDKPMQGSYVETHLGIGGDKTTISAQGLIFPLLLQETIRGMFELFSAHGLPQDTKKAQYIVKKADFVLAEPWDLRLGVGLWKRVFGKVQDTNMIPYMFKNLASLNTDEFYISMKEILSSTKKGNEIIDSLMTSAEHDNGYQQFTNRINDKNLNQSLINDSYFNGAETNGYEVDDETTDGEVIEEDGVNDSTNQEIETWYRGLCGNFNESLNKRQIWLAETPEYAALYAEECEDGHLYAFDVDMSRYKGFDWYYNAPNWFEPIDGFSGKEQKELMQEGYNGYMFPLDECTVLVLFDPSLIVNVREIPLSDYLEESNSHNQQENELITESQELKSIHINKVNKLNESKSLQNVRFVGMCDSMQLYVNDNKVAYYDYMDSTAYPFIIYDNKLYIGDKGKPHGPLMRQIPHYDRYNESNIEGRIWVSAKVNEFNYSVVAFWGTSNTSYNCKPYVIELANKLKVNPNKIVIVINSDDDMYPQPIQEWDGFIHEVDEEEQEAKNLHMMNAKDKYDNTSGFRQTRDRKIGKKLSNDKGQEMPLAQYHNLIYQEGKKNKGIFVTEEQYKKLIENIIPIESGVINKDKYQGNLADKEFYYFGDCKNTVDVDKMWNATQMSNFLENSQLINPKHVINKLHNGDRIMPKPLLKAINNPKMQIVCGINEYQKIMFIYLTDNDTHYFFDVMNNNRKTKAYLSQKNNIKN